MESLIKKVLHTETMVFVYETKELRAAHVQDLEKDGWEAGHRVARLKPGTSIHDYKDEDNYEWFAEFQKYHE